MTPAVMPGALRVRAAFVGQSTYFGACSLPAAARCIDSAFFDYRAGADIASLLEDVQSFSPDVVVAFRPEVFPRGTFNDVGAVVLGFLTEPLPRDGHSSHSDLERRLGELTAVDARGFDRIVCFDPMLREAVAQAGLELWRSVPLPVHDRYFASVRPTARPPRCIFVGRSTEHRERFLLPLKHAYDLLHVAHGLDADALDDLLQKTDIGINLHNEPYPSFENRVCLHLAAGHLVITEPLSPTHGLEPLRDYLEVQTPEALSALVGRIHRNSDMFWRVRLYGRRKAELFRASSVYPRLFVDLSRDLESRESRRRRQPSRRHLKSLAALRATLVDPVPARVLT